MTIFDNGIDPDPMFSGQVEGKIYLDEKKNLRLMTRPLGQEEEAPARNEILFAQVDSFAFEFLGRKTAPDSGVKETFRPITAEYCWRSCWPKNLKEAPSIIRLLVYEKSNKEPTSYTFILPILEPFATYSKKKT